MKTKLVLPVLAFAFTALAQTNNSATPPAPADVATSEDFWKWAIGAVSAVVLGVVVYFLKKKKAK